MNVVAFFGRLHPLILHLPIGILAIAFLMELWGRRQQTSDLNLAIGFSLWIGMFCAVLAAVSGYVLSLEGGYEENMLNQHQWLGIATAAASIGIYFAHKTSSAGWGQKVYFPLFGLTMLLLGAAGHQGGSLTHGSDFLLEPFSDQDRNDEVMITNLDSALVFQDLIQPILNQKCVSCHNEPKTKGELLMTSIAGLQTGGKTGAFMVSSNVASSLFLQRIHLPSDDKEHMPPRGKTQLTPEEVAILEWWVEEGGAFDKKIADIHRSDEIQEVLEEYTAREVGVFALENVKPLNNSTIVELHASGLPVEMVAQDKPFVTLSLRGRQDLTEQTFVELGKAADQLIELDLSRSNVTDQMVAQMANFPHLTKLFLQQTELTGSELAQLAPLEYLEYINLYQTAIGNDALEALASIKSLKNLYLWQTNMSTQAIAELQEQQPQLVINAGADRTIFGSAKLNPPLIKVDRDLFLDTLTVAFELNFKAVEFYYTLDGTTPDSNATRYTEPFVLNESADIRVVAKKEGWKTSEPAEKLVTLARYRPDHIALSRPPHERYQAQGGASLGDFIKGTIIFTTGEWLGYEGEHFTATLDLGEVSDVSNVTVSSLEDSRSYIFFPAKINIWTSANGKDYKLAAQQDIPVTSEPTVPELKSFVLNFGSQPARFIKVEVRSNLVNPSWHQAPGAPCWIFVDEIVVG